MQFLTERDANYLTLGTPNDYWFFLPADINRKASDCALYYWMDSIVVEQDDEMEQDDSWEAVDMYPYDIGDC